MNPKSLKRGQANTGMKETLEHPPTQSIQPSLTLDTQTPGGSVQSHRPPWCPAREGEPGPPPHLPVTMLPRSEMWATELPPGWDQSQQTSLRGRFPFPGLGLSLEQMLYVTKQSFPCLEFYSCQEPS